MPSTKTIRVYGNGLPDLEHKVSLDRTTAPNFPKVLEAVSNVIVIEGGVRKLYTLPDLKQVKSLEQLFKAQGVFIAVGKNGKVDRSKLPVLKLRPAAKKGNKLPKVEADEADRSLGAYGQLPGIKPRDSAGSAAVDGATAALLASGAADEHLDSERDRQKRAHQERMQNRQRQRQNNQALKIEQYADGAELLEKKNMDERQRQKQMFQDKLQARARSARRARGGYTQEEAAVVIQSSYRGFKGRKAVKLRRAEKYGSDADGGDASAGGYSSLLAAGRIPTPDLSFSQADRDAVEQAAAMQIQASWKGHKARKAHPLPKREARLKREAAQRAQAKEQAVSKAQNKAKAQLNQNAPAEKTAPAASPPAGKKKGKPPKETKEEKKARKLAEKQAKKERGSKKKGAAASPRPPALERQNSRFSLRGVEDKSLVTAMYEMGKKIGDGNFAEVRLCVHKESKVTYAIKIIDKSKTLRAKESKMIENEIKTMRALSHPNCTALFDVIDTPDELFLVLEYVRGGDLFDRIVQVGKYEESEAARVVKAMAVAIHHMHSKNIIHRDLKPENLLVTKDVVGKDTIKLADFGLAMEVVEPLHTVCGTPTYVAPEIISQEKDESTPGYGLPADLWAIGVISYIVLCGFPPFASATKSQKDLFNKIKKGKFTFPKHYWDRISDDAKDLISGLLVVDPSKRMTAEQVLESPWITKMAPGDAGKPAPIDNSVEG